MHLVIEESHGSHKLGLCATLSQFPRGQLCDCCCVGLSANSEAYRRDPEQEADPIRCVAALGSEINASDPRYAQSQYLGCVLRPDHEV